jgi:hypothetical protein
MSELKPCPFCGGEAELCYSEVDIFCRKCNVMQETELWNTRPIEDNLIARIAELEAAQRWRVVADGELPEVYRDEDGEFIPFLVCEGDGDRPFIAMYGGTNWHAGIFVPDVTHWMPLPELPEVKE